MAPAGVASLAIVALAISSPAAQAAPRRTPQPIYWGAAIGDQLTGTQPPWDMGAVSAFEGLVGKGMSLVSLNSPFQDCSGPCTFYSFPTTMMERIRSYGAIPFFNWSSQSIPADPTNSSAMPAFQLSDLIEGTYDAYIREFAEEARAWGHPFFLRFDWEMNGNWFPWGAGVNGNGPGEFVAAWRHVHDIFTSVGAGNATWVWCPYTEIDRRFASLKPLYPGNRYVDWTCMDGFNWASNPTNPHPWRSFGQIFDSTYRNLTRRIAPGKPIVIAEMASTGGSGARSHWIRDMFKELGTSFRSIRGLIWFDQVDRGIEWPLETSPAATAAFAKGIRGRGFAANRFSGAGGGPIQPLR